MAASAGTSQIKTAEKVSKNTPEPVTGYEEFMIAADLTLYANPLRCLVKKPSSNQQAASKPPETVQAKDTDDIIAADLTKYGSPLDDKN